MAKNNQKREKAIRNKENARKYQKKASAGGRRFSGPRPSAPASSPSPAAPSAPAAASAE